MACLARPLPVLLLLCFACRAGGIEGATVADPSGSSGATGATQEAAATALPSVDADGVVTSQAIATPKQADGAAAADAGSAADGNEQDGTAAGTATATATSTASKNSHAAKVLTTVPAATMAALAAKVPARLAAQMANIEAAAESYNLQPQLLVAVAMQESTGGADQNAYDNGGGMFQFTDEDTWKQFGTQNKADRQNDALSVRAAAYYLAFELNENDGNLDKALRAYNGAISDGGLPEYQSDIKAKMKGNF